MKPTLALSLAGLLVFLAAGCANPSYMRARAQALAPTVAEMRRQREAQIDRLNTQYQQTFNGLMSELQLVDKQERRQTFLADAQANADALLFEWEKRSLKSELHGLFARTIDAEMQKFDAITEALAQARSNYADAYAEITLKLDRLKSVEAKIKDLQNSDPLSPDTLAFLGAVVKEVKAGLDNTSGK